MIDLNLGASPVKAALVRLSLALCILAAFACQGACDFRCHMQHTEVSYHAAYTTQDCTCLQRDEKTGWCSFESCHTDYHPARCSVGIVCDMRCKAVDTGAAEAHPDHPPRTTHAPIVHSRCTLGGSVR